MSDPDPAGEERGVADALRDAIERTLQATAPAASQTRERAGELLDEVARLGEEARAELSRRGQEAREEITRRRQGAGAELSKRLEAVERRLASIEELMRGGGSGLPGESAPPSPDSNPKAEG
jgi:polyhydroxyalkanoate synthesis regulator phasin